MRSRTACSLSSSASQPAAGLLHERSLTSAVLRRLCLTRVEELKQQAAELRQAELRQQQEAAQRPAAAPAAAAAAAAPEDDSDSEPPPDSLFDWRAKRM